MKATPIALVLGIALFASNARADSDDALWGALVGGAVGVLIGENSSDIRTEHAVPALAALGALTGYAHDRDNYYDDDWSHRGPVYNRGRYYGSNRYGSNRHAYRYNDRSGRNYNVHYPYWPSQVRRYSPVRRAPRAVQTYPKAKKTPQQTVAPTNRHPGVTIVRVPITWPNGTTRNIRVLRLGNRYVGPQGESYETLPDSATLSERYAPAPSTP
jgi:hypothetical protein